MLLLAAVIFLSEHFPTSARLQHKILTSGEVKETESVIILKLIKNIVKHLFDINRHQIIEWLCLL